MSEQLKAKPKEKPDSEPKAAEPAVSTEAETESVPGVPLFLRGAIGVSQPGDSHERNARETAARVMSGTNRRAAGRKSSPPESIPGLSSAFGQPLDSETLRMMEPRFGQDFGQVRVHTGAKADAAARAVHALAFTRGQHIVFAAGQYKPATPSGRHLIAHELAHVSEQAGAGMLMRQDTATAEPTTAADARRQTFNLSEDEMEARLAATPPNGADTSAPTVEVEPETESKLNEVENKKEKDEGKEGEAEGEGKEGKEKEGEGKEGKEGKGKGGRGEGGAGSVGGETAPPAQTPGPAGEFEGMVRQPIGDYLEGNFSPERLDQLDPVTQQLLDGAEALGNRRLTDPEASALGAAQGGLPAQAPKAAYTLDEPWMQTISTVRNALSTIGGVVGVIGLVATVSGFILSLLIPPVGAFLLTVGRFCDIAALILDGISLILSAILTGINYYRLKNATDPEEKRRLLGLVRQEGMQTVMSGIAVATAVAPGAARMLGRSRPGRLVGRGLRAGGQRIAGAAGRLAAQPTRLGRAAATVGRVGAAGAARARGVGRAVSGEFHTFMGRWRDYGFRTAAGSAARRAGRAIAGTRIGGALARTGVPQALGRLATGGFGYARRGAAWLGSTRAAGFLGRAGVAGFGGVRQGAAWLGRTRAAQWLGRSRLGQWAQRTYGRNLDLARLLYSSSERSHHLYVGSRLRAELNRLQQGGGLASDVVARQQLQQRFPQRDWAEVNVQNLDFRRAAPPPAAAAPAPGAAATAAPTPTPTSTPTAAAATPAAGAAPTGAAGANAPLQPLEFVRNESRLKTQLSNMRQTEAQQVNALINSGASDADIARQLNERPNAPARWTEDEIWSFRQQSSRQRVPKTPHHTISVLDAPHLQYDPRYIQLGNAPLVQSYEAFTTRAVRRPPTPGAAAPDVPFVRRTDQAADWARGTTTFADGRPLQGTFPPDYFRSEQFYRELQLRGNTGVWVNPNDPTQRLLFDAHFVAGHRWQTGEAGAGALFGPQVDFGERFQGTVGRTLLDQSIAGYGRTQAHFSDTWQNREQAWADWMLGSFGMIPREGEAPGAVSAAGGEMGSEMGGEEAVMLAAAATESPEEMPAEAGMGIMSMLPRFLGGAGGSMLSAVQSVSGNGAGGAEEPRIPPSPVPYSPQALVSIREQRTQITDAIADVNSYIQETQKVERDNQLAKEAAEALAQRNEEEATFAETERADVSGQQDKLTESETAQQKMSEESARASSESERGKGEADTVQSEGQNVSVEPKPEEPKSRSWLERAWDATVGALWDNLIAPAVRAVKRKVKQVMESINEFIMDMINQALGLDEIEAELESGGTDIQDRRGSLQETDTGLQEQQDQAAAEQERNAQSAQQADQNIADAQNTRSDAETLLADLLAHNDALKSEEESGTSYISDFATSYQPYFEQQEAMGGEMASAAPEAEAPLEETPAAPEMESESVSEVTPQQEA